MNKLFAAIFAALIVTVSSSAVSAAPTKAQGPKKVELPRTFVGTLTAVDTTTGVITVDAKKKGSVVTTVTETTPVVDSEGTTIALTDLAVGDKVKVQGTYNFSTSGFSTVKQVKDLSVIAPTETPTPTP